MALPALDDCNIVWNSQSTNSGESMPCGGGDVGLNVWVENGELLFYLARSGTFDELNRMPKLGRVRIAISPNPFSPGGAFTQTLNLRRGCVEICGKSDGCSATVELWVDVHRPVVHVEIQTDVPSQITATYENWRLVERPFEKPELHASRSWIGAPVIGTVRPDQVQFHGPAVQFMHRNEGFTAFDLTVEQQGLNHVKAKMWNPLDGLTFGGSMTGDDLVAAGTVEGRFASTPFKGWCLCSGRPSGKHHVQIALNVAAADSTEAWEAGLRDIESTARQDRTAARAATELWWREFWERSWVFINPKQPDAASEAWQAGRNYQLFRYQLGCNAYGTWPTKFNGGLFTFDPEFVDPKRPFDPDFRLWGGGSFTAQNQRLVYWPMLRSGDFDMMRPQFEFYRRVLDNARLRSQVYWGIDAACFPEQVENFGLSVSYEYGWKRKPEVEPGVEDSAWVNYQWDTVFEFCQMILETHRYAGADIRAYLPLIESCLEFYDAYYRMQATKRTGRPLGENGKLEIVPGTACETYKDARNSTPTVAALKVVLATLMELPATLLTDDRKQRWRDMLSTIPEISTREKDGRQTIAPAAAWSRKQNCELPQLYSVYPWGLHGIGRPDLQLAIDTWRFGADAPDQKQTISWHQDPIFCARLGLTNEAAALMFEKLKDAPRRFPTWWGPGHDWVPDHNWGGSGMIALQEMLVQTVDRTIYLLPAWPTEWDVHFKLHAPFETVIEADWSGGAMRSLTVTPASRLADVVIMPQAKQR